MKSDTSKLLSINQMFIEEYTQCLSSLTSKMKYLSLCFFLFLCLSPRYSFNFTYMNFIYGIL